MQHQGQRNKAYYLNAKIIPKNQSDIKNKPHPKEKAVVSGDVVANVVVASGGDGGEDSSLSKVPDHTVDPPELFLVRV